MNAPNRAPPLRADQVAVRLGSTDVLRGLTLALEPGWTAIVGRNGAGKSTLLHVLAGLLEPQRGEVRIGGRPLAELSRAERARTIAWLAQSSEPSGDLSVREVVALGRLPHLGLTGAATPADLVAVADALGETGCRGLAERQLDALSGGERQRVLLARALAVEADWLLLDEPTTFLDPPHQAAFIRLLRRLAGRGVGVVSVLHDLTLALNADRVVVVDRGNVVASGAAADAPLHAALVDVFEGAIRIERVAHGWAVLPVLER